MTRGGVHYARIGARGVPAHKSEYANDPVFGFSTGVLIYYVAEQSGCAAVPASLVE
ncbi:four-carbon acid sugar kinase family protein [Nocardia sp. NPDC059239]|uniref:four-carbon acid sugar kinase family protein n=1 Tax=Nocardia sp. NPDC059239 TaxID=3346785 RepID=UPI0036B315A6